ncbi:MAG: ATP-binding cassette domain-containing protein [Rhizobiaceae bacterium]
MRNGSNVSAVDDVSFHIMPGETLALAGPSGSGKSTVARLVMRLLRPDAGTIALEGSDLLNIPAGALRRFRARFQMVFQDSTAAFNPRSTVARALDDPLRIHGIAGRAGRPRAIAQLLEQVGLSPSLAGRAIHEISGGQRQRVALARAMATNPSLIVLDEALSAVDASIRGDLLRLLLDLQVRRNVAFLFISHDLALVRAIAHRVAIMDAGRVVETGAATSVIDAPQSVTAKALVAAVPRLHA